ncbi:MAG: D-cysteine desulfhydrase family protein [Calditrichaeota bacterium]|nr:MAG: D-cysteine desulfhydrase family protein [Calditrichota bacterium]MBL1206738.1 D-cysteine desulfhydrase family protein [Calditrichota bacterium]NOG46564.1 D-cysteine desulfhydrase family protein [Calditrichota bacterium]
MKKPNLPEHFNFSNLPTPIVPLKIKQNNSFYNLMIKRDDFTGVELSGNKIRKLDFLLKDAVEAGAQRIITCGSYQSNHCRAAVFAANKIGLKTTLVLKGTAPGFVTGNYLLLKMSGAEIIFITEDEYQNVDSYMEKLAGEGNEKSYVIPEGGSNEVGSWGYAKCFFEILDQIEKQLLKCDTIVVATGSGGTHAGLLAGKKLTKSDINIVSVNVCDNAPHFRNKVDKVLEKMKKRYDLDLSWTESEINIVDGYVGEGYGQLSGAEEKLALKMVKEEGLVFDLVYGIKAFGAMLNLMSKNQFPGKDIIFIHTGGIFGVFPYWQELEKTMSLK